MCMIKRKMKKFANRNTISNILETLSNCSP